MGLSKRSCVLTLALAAGSFQAYAGSIQLGSVSDLSPGDTNLSFTGTQEVPTASPVSYTAGGNTLTFSNTGGFELLQANTNYFGSAFPANTVILYGSGYSGPGGPLTIDFSNPVSQVGLNIEEYVSGPYTVTFSAYDGATLLGTYTANGSDPEGGFASDLSFEGVEATGGDVITSIVFTDNEGDSANMGVGPILFGSAATPTPEPGTFALLFTGLTGLGEMVRRRAIRR